MTNSASRAELVKINGLGLFVTEAEMAILTLIRPFDPTMYIQKALKCEVKRDAIYETAAVLILATGLELIAKKTSVAEVRAELESLYGLLHRARAWRLCEAAAMVRNQITNFL